MAWTKSDPNRTRHTCGGPKFGRLTVGCPACDELRDGIREPTRWAKRSDGYPSIEAIRAHDCKKSNCGPVCTFGQW